MSLLTLRGDRCFGHRTPLLEPHPAGGAVVLVNGHAGIISPCSGRAPPLALLFPLDRWVGCLFLAGRWLLSWFGRRVVRDCRRPPPLRDRVLRPHLLVQAPLGRHNRRLRVKHGPGYGIRWLDPTLPAPPGDAHPAHEPANKREHKEWTIKDNRVAGKSALTRRAARPSAGTPAPPGSTRPHTRSRPNGPPRVSRETRSPAPVPAPPGSSPAT